MKHRWLYRAALAFLVYILLLALLTSAERAYPQASIRSFGDAVWYSLVTLTTVGYGDLYPVSPLGRAVGLLFVLLSIGALASLISALTAFLRRRVIPAVRLGVLRKNSCYLFSEANGSALALARDLIRSEPKAYCAFFGEGEPPAAVSALGRRSLFISGSIADTAPRLAGQGTRAVFLTHADPMKNLAEARALSGLQLRLYCFGPETGDLPGVQYFDIFSGIARTYWNAHPLKRTETVVLLQGSGRLARELLDQAILVNCREPFQRTVCHLFGDWAPYLREHFALGQVFTFDAEDTRHDALQFHQEAWSARPELLEAADRVILCEDDPAANAEAAQRLIRYFPFRGQLHAAAPVVPSPAVAFGADEEACTADAVMRSALDARARKLHEMYCRSTGADTTWEALPLFLKMSNRASADHLLTKLRLLLPEQDITEITPAVCEEAAERWRRMEDHEPCRQNEHLRWMRFYALYNWRRGPEKNETLRTHPCLVPYAELSPEDREKDENAWLQISRLAAEGGRK